jgi:DegV family protein with EDD domain
MRKVLLVADIVSDLDKDFARAQNIVILPMTYILDDIEYDDINIDHMEPKELYDKMRAGAMPKTAQITPEFAKAQFVRYINKGYDIFYLTCSSGISGTLNSAMLAKSNVEEGKKELITKENQDFKIVIVDSLSASLGYGMLVTSLSEAIKEDFTIEELKHLALSLIPKVCHFFTVDDLNHLKRGGRVSGASALIGTLLQIKPILNISNDGILTPIAKVKGRKKSLKTLVDYMEQKVDISLTKTIYISHGDCLEDAIYLKAEIVKRFGELKFIINTIGPIVGSHSGPGTLALFFYGSVR